MTTRDEAQRRVRKLRAKAASTTFPDEAAEANRLADKLERQHQLRPDPVQRMRWQVSGRVVTDAKVDDLMRDLADAVRTNPGLQVRLGDIFGEPFRRHTRR